MQKIILIVLALLCTKIQAQELSRRAKWDASIAFPSEHPGAKIRSLEKGTPLDKAGLLPGDLILKVNTKLVTNGEVWTSITYALRANQNIELMVKRGSEVFKKSIQLPPIPFEKHKHLETIYEEVTSDYGITQRMIITRPKGGGTSMPAVIMLQGLSCSTLEVYSERKNNWANMITEIVEKTGAVVMRVDKPGVGDSEGDCAETDFLTELAGYRAAIEMLKKKEYIDTSRIVVYGSSMGSALAPLFANEFNLAGVVSDGTIFKTWFEHMLEIERRIRQMQGDDEESIARKMNEAFIPLYYGMLIQKKSYGQVLNEYPAIAEYNYHPLNHMYGRPLAYYQQLQDYPLSSQWEKVKVPVRILYGGNDWIMSEYDNNMIIDVLERSGHEDHKLVIYPGLDHWNTIHKTPSDSFFGNPGEWDPAMADLVVGWIREMVE